ncbi:N-acetylmuramoyl-L-alanine amidase [Lysobacter sp. Root916]|uniref:N-acetylmuramoyl-L-alanine amidase n=1 Tax=Lysobacter sp. Root916 TaxID=1736606 RepID=UPI0009E6A685|nr:N-acetylmuramoyl-L-alanine amidase [Lysobacter sp. Root916]
MALLAALAWNLAHASEIKGLDVGSGATGTRAEIALDRGTEFKLISLKGPDRLAVDLPASSLAKGLRLPTGAGIVKSVRTGQPAPGTVRIVFDLAQPVAALKPRIEPAANGARLVLEWPGDGVEPQPVAAPPAASVVAAHTTPVPSATVPQSAPSPAATAVVSEHRGVDQAASSAAATTRLISELAARNASSAPAIAAPAAAAPVATVAPPPVQTTIATGVPTRIASGVPTPMPGAAASAPPADDLATPGAVKTMKDVMRGRGMRPLIIAIDPGHGGQDPGAVGQAGKREKDVTLAIARELARQINATPGLKAYLTRDSDVFIPLPRRAQLARQAKADMFVSIHADAAENRAAKGSSVYVLSLKGASSQRARWLADKENSADLVGGVRLQEADNTLTSVLLDLTQSGHMKASEDAAAHVLDGLKRVGNNHKPHIERANFAVLRTSDMPAMLVETAFISNPDEERRLTDPAHQRALARAVLDGVNTYFTRQPPPGTLYAARADAQPVAMGGGGGSP